MSSKVSQEQLAILMQEHEASLIAYCTDFVGYHSACDAVQDAFIELMRYSKPIRHKRAWLFKVCRNKSIDLLRKEGRMHLLEHDADICDQAQQTPAAQMDAHDTIEDVKDVIKQLPLKHQEILRLKFRENMSYKSIAELTGLRVSNVGFILHSILRSLRSSQRLEEAIK